MLKKRFIHSSASFHCFIFLVSFIGVIILNTYFGQYYIKISGNFLNLALVLAEAHPDRQAWMWIRIRILTRQNLCRSDRIRIHDNVKHHSKHLRSSPCNCSLSYPEIFNSTTEDPGSDSVTGRRSYHEVITQSTLFPQSGTMNLTTSLCQSPHAPCLPKEEEQLYLRPAFCLSEPFNPRYWRFILKSTDRKIYASHILVLLCFLYCTS